MSPRLVHSGMEKVIVVGKGKIVGQSYGLWAVDNGSANVYIAPADVLFANPKVGDTGVLTYEYRGVSRRPCFRAVDPSR